MNIILLKLYTGADLIAECESGDEENYKLKGVYFVLMGNANPDGTCPFQLRPWAPLHGENKLTVDFPRSMVALSTLKFDEGIRRKYLEVTSPSGVILPDMGGRFGRG